MPADQAQFSDDGNDTDPDMPGLIDDGANNDGANNDGVNDDDANNDGDNDDDANSNDDDDGTVTFNPSIIDSRVADQMLETFGAMMPGFDRATLKQCFDSILIMGSLTVRTDGLSTAVSAIASVTHDARAEASSDALTPCERDSALATAQGMCVICQCDYKSDGDSDGADAPPRALVSLKCDHVFCRECIETCQQTEVSLAHTTVCPLCKVSDLNSAAPRIAEAMGAPNNLQSLESVFAQLFTPDTLAAVSAIAAAASETNRQLKLQRYIDKMVTADPPTPPPPQHSDDVVIQIRQALRKKGPPVEFGVCNSAEDIGVVLANVQAAVAAENVAAAADESQQQQPAPDQSSSCSVQ